MSITFGQVARNLASAGVKKLIYGTNVALVGYEVGKIVHHTDEVKIQTVTEKIVVREHNVEIHTYILIFFVVLLTALLLIKWTLNMCNKYKSNTTVTTQASIELGKMNDSSKPEPKIRQRSDYFE